MSLLSLINWRREIFSIYNEVRSEEDGIIAWNKWKDKREKLFKFHPEIKNLNNAEMESLVKIKRNSDDRIIDEEHTTLPIMTRYEKAKILGIRSTQLNSGAEPFIDIPSNIIDGITIARMELEKKAIPFIIRRNLPNGKSEYWNIEDLEIL